MKVFWLVVMAAGLIVAVSCVRPLVQNDREPAALSAPKLGESREDWAVDPYAAGVRLPPAGSQSLFDSLFKNASTGNYELPPTFSELKNFLESSDGLNGTMTGVLIPMGRSLQRNAAAPHYFEFPRIVLAATGQVAAAETPSHLSQKTKISLVGKNQLFFGYVESSRQIEVISYNERAGRFEFQVVSNYGVKNSTGGNLQPVVEYADRNFCMSCHQNQSPIFPRPSSRTNRWEETSGSDDVFEALASSPLVKHLSLQGRRRSYHGVPFHNDLNAPRLIDDATDSANLYSVYQRIWRDACITPECKAKSLEAMILYRLTGQGTAWLERADLQQQVFGTLRENFKKWPKGLWIPNADIPNRNPLAKDPLDQCDLKAAREIYQIANPDDLKIFIPDEIRRDGAQVLDQLDRSTPNILPACNPRNPRAPSTTTRLSSLGPIAGEKASSQYPEVDESYLYFHILGLANMFTDSDMKLIDRFLSESVRSQKVGTKASCKVFKKEDRWETECASPDMKAMGSISFYAKIWIGSKENFDLEISSAFLVDRPKCRTDFRERLMNDSDIPCGRLESLHGSGKYLDGNVVFSDLKDAKGLAPRFAQGVRIEKIEFSFAPDRKELGTSVHINLVDDNVKISQVIASVLSESRVSEARKIGSGIFADKPFSRVLILERILRHLGAVIELPRGFEGNPFVASYGDRLFLDSKVDQARIPQAFAHLKPFFKHCSQCHSGSQNSVVPNFLYTKEFSTDSLKKVERNLQICSERIFDRVNQWDSESQLTGPMPPFSYFAEIQSRKSDFDIDRTGLLAPVKKWLTEKYKSDKPSDWYLPEGACQRGIDGK